MTHKKIIEKRQPSIAVKHQVRAELEKLYPFTSFSDKSDRFIGVGCNTPCGIDIELLTTKHPSFADFVMSAAEHNKVNDPIMAWSIKESCYKIFNDGYEPSDFIILEVNSQYAIVQSKNYKYSVSLWTKEGFLHSLACAR